MIIDQGVLRIKTPRQSEAVILHEAYHKTKNSHSEADKLVIDAGLKKELEALRERGLSRYT